MRDSAAPAAVEQAAEGVSAPVSDLTGDMLQLPSDGGGLEPWMAGCCRLINAMYPEGLMPPFTGDCAKNNIGLCGEEKIP